jgi:leucyl/phenylalanyl-tRNA--protein transferase
MVFLLDKSLTFPDPKLADDDGLLAIGGDLSIERLVLAYQNGIFPWYADNEPILWYSPHERFVIFAEEIHISRSMRDLIRSEKYHVTWDRDFVQVITQCAAIKRKGQRGTWITDDMLRAYTALFDKGIAHSAEIWQHDILVGGVYGVDCGNIFCGESMFSLVPNASKLALIHVSQNKKYRLIDCQMHTPHLESMGGWYISRNEYMEILKS